jgi:hypothetical protein
MPGIGARRRAGPSYARLRPDPSYNITVDVVNGNISHPNILTFKGRVASPGAVRASVRSDGSTRPDRVRVSGGIGEAPGAPARASRGVRDVGGAEKLKVASHGAGSE